MVIFTIEIETTRITTYLHTCPSKLLRRFQIFNMSPRVLRVACHLFSSQINGRRSNTILRVHERGWEMSVVTDPEGKGCKNSRSATHRSHFIICAIVHWGFSGRRRQYHHETGHQSAALLDERGLPCPHGN